MTSLFLVMNRVSADLLPYTIIKVLWELRDCETANHFRFQNLCAFLFYTMLVGHKHF